MVHDGIKADVVGNDLSQGRDDATGLGGHSSLFRRQVHAKVARRTVAIAFRTGRRSRLEGHGDRLPRTSQAGLYQRNQVALSKNMVPQYFMFHSITFSAQFPFWQYTPFSDMCCLSWKASFMNHLKDVSPSSGAVSMFTYFGKRSDSSDCRISVRAMVVPSLLPISKPKCLTSEVHSIKNQNNLISTKGIAASYLH